ncbi:unnamed protein product [Orchesella dallaii]|uniref:Uncharacterized protein n=1 Tax=Orchesella dallaii TaxID=48710 RepID=A0ABP1RFC9_9HEXA
MFEIKSNSSFLKLLFLLITTSASLINGKVVPIKKCCRAGDVIDVSVMKCRDSGSTKWAHGHLLYSDTDNEHGEADVSGIDGYSITSKIPQCPGTGVHIIPLRDLDEHSIYAAKFRLLPSGKIVAKHANGHWITVPENSCVDGLQNFEESGDLYSGSKNDQALITCPLLEDES